MVNKHKTSYVGFDLMILQQTAIGLTKEINGFCGKKFREMALLSV